MLTEDQYNAHIERINVLCGKGLDNLTKEEDKEMDDLDDRVLEYEAQHFKMPMDND